MKDLNDILTALGFRHIKRAPECWRITRIGAPTPSPPARHRREPANSRILPRWLDRLADRDRPSPYRITQVTPGAGAERRRASR